MMPYWLRSWQRRAKRRRAPRAPLRVKCLEERNLLSGLKVVSSPQISGQLLAAAAIADNDIWAVGFSDQVTAPPVVDSTLAEHWDGTSWSIVSTPPTPSGGVNPPNAQFLGVAAAASNDVWAVGFKTGPDNPDFGEQLIEHWNGTSWPVR